MSDTGRFFLWSPARRIGYRQAPLLSALCVFGFLFVGCGLPQTPLTCRGPSECPEHTCVNGQCGEASCTDSTRNGAESDVDCGGLCAPCADGNRCRLPSDCQSQRCGFGGLCEAASCTNGVRDGRESDRDCGGGCAPCGEGSHCVTARDCASSICLQGSCAPPNCQDHVRNGQETDVDCGGPCARCPSTARCEAPTDCASGVCSGNVCQAPGCTNGAKDGDETDVDCGGACRPCTVGAACGVALDCESGSCDQHVCQPATCQDGVRNGRETDTDCGGGACPACAVNHSCVRGGDCESLTCIHGLCATPSCSDGVRNGDETGLDCGGSCSPCPPGQGCHVPADCLSQQCHWDVCQQPVGCTGCGGACGACPPVDPSTVAPPVSDTSTSVLAETMSFLFSGPNAIQRGVVPGTIQPERLAILRGRVLDAQGMPLSAVTVSISRHPELGYTLTRDDGRFDLAVNGGGSLLVQFARSGSPVVQRTVQTPWQDFTPVADVVLVGLDPSVTEVDPLQPYQVARASPVTDASGTRRSTLLFLQGTQVGLELARGESLILPGPFHVRSTEFTVGSAGASAMPGSLPNRSAYTYATEFSVDEARAVDATRVTFSRPVIQYLENFLHFDVGGLVPTGSYSAEKGQWISDENGRVVKLLDVVAGLATLDVEGKGSAADDATLAALGILPAEREALATLYLPGQSLWRIPLRHFSAWDFNWPFGFPPDAKGPDIGDLKRPSDPWDAVADGRFRCTKPGSRVRCQDQALGESLPLPGTPFSLHYESSRVPGHATGNAVVIPASGPQVPSSLKRIEVSVRVAGRTFESQLPGQPLQSHTFGWDGLDAYGRTLQGKQPLTVNVSYVYDGVYMTPAQTAGVAQQAAVFGHFTYDGRPASGDATRKEVSLSQEVTGEISRGSGWDARAQGLGGWTISVHHAYDPVGHVLYLGNGDMCAAPTSRPSCAPLQAPGRQALGETGNPRGGPGCASPWGWRWTRRATSTWPSASTTASAR